MLNGKICGRVVVVCLFFFFFFEANMPLCSMFSVLCWRDMRSLNT